MIRFRIILRFTKNAIKRKLGNCLIKDKRQQSSIFGSDNLKKKLFGEKYIFLNSV